MPQYEDVYEPPLLDATFIDKIDDLIAELQNLSAPSATNVAVSPTGLHYITEDDAQGALAELDAECYSLSNSLMQKTTSQNAPSTHDFNAFTTDGVRYWVNGSWTNGISIYVNGIVEICEYSGYVIQKFYALNDILYIRHYDNASHTWSNWKAQS